MGRDPRDVAAQRIRNRLDAIQSEIDDECYARDVAFSRDYEYRMSDARLAGLRAEKEQLKEILGDL